MAFTQKSKFTSSGLMNRMPNKAKLINNSKTAFHQELPERFVALKSETFKGEQVPTYGYVEETKNFEDSRPYEDVYAEFDLDPVSGGRINSKTGTIYSNIDEFIADADKSRTSKVYYEGDVDVVSGTPDVVSTKYPQGLVRAADRFKAKGDPEGWKNYLQEKGIEIDDELRNYLASMRELSKKRDIREEEKKNRAEYCKRNPDKCRPSGEKEVIRTTTKGTPSSETYTGLRRVN